MFSHKGKTRNIKHNLQIASLLSFVAGIVNVVGFLSVQQLTTNVTGHFAFLIEEVFNLDLSTAFVYFLYIFFFFAGSFVSSFIIEIVSRRNEHNIYLIPAALEIIILGGLAVIGKSLIAANPHLLVFALLFAMGLQNSFVTTISNATVRTTHLTGLFTDLGIELSRLFFYKKPEERNKLHSLIKLRFTIIACFFAGGIAGGFLYNKLNIHALFIAALLLLTGLAYDYIKLQIVLQKRKKHHK
jgi:uncharacterized membrane protein YoaK (UPF0700 family)